MGLGDRTVWGMELRNVNNRSHLACGTVSSFCESYKPWLLDIRIECGKQRDNLSFLSRYSTLDGENTNIRTVRHAADVISISIFVDSEENPVIFRDYWGYDQSSGWQKRPAHRRWPNIPSSLLSDQTCCPNQPGADARRRMSQHDAVDTGPLIGREEDADSHEAQRRPCVGSETAQTPTSVEDRPQAESQEAPIWFPALQLRTQGGGARGSEQGPSSPQVQVEVGSGNSEPHRARLALAEADDDSDLEMIGPDDLQDAEGVTCKDESEGWLLVDNEA